ncbi:MAG: folate-binding protein [Aquificaceae bacterium]|nr:folate-binding protein [Aquificaceae bacterium]
MKWIRLERSKIKVYGKTGKLLSKGITEEHTAFLHSLFTNDIKNMKDHTVVYNLWLKHNGFPVGDFFVYKLGDEYILDTSLDGKHVVEEFNKIKLSLKVYFEVLEYDHVFLFGEGAGEFIKSQFGVELKEGEVFSKDGSIVARNSLRLKDEGYDVIGAGVPVQKEDEISEEVFEDLRIERLVPKLGKELREGFSPLESCVLRYAINLNKGCYVGQEAIARVYYRGKLPRSLALFEGDGLSEGEKIKADGKDVGVITSVSSLRPIALGYILRAKAEDKLQTEQGKALRLIKLCEP